MTGRVSGAASAGAGLDRRDDCEAKRSEAMQAGAALGTLLLLALAADARRLDADFEFDDDASPPVSSHHRQLIPTYQFSN